MTGDDVRRPVGQVVFEQEAEFIAKVLALLNTAPTVEGLYLDVRLVEAGSHEVVGEFSDEVASTDWSFTWVATR